MKIFIVANLVLLLSAFLCAQENTKPALRPTQSAQQMLAEQSKTIAELDQHVKDLERRIQVLERSSHEWSSTTPATAPKLNLDNVKLSLAGFENDCKIDQDKAFAFAISEGKPAQTYEGAAAMNCTERLRQIVEELVGSLERQQ